LSGPKPLVLPG